MTAETVTHAPVCPFDHHSEAFAADYLGTLDELREYGPVTWTDAHGGYWVATSHETVRAALQDAAFVTSPTADGTSGGLRIPRSDRARDRPLVIPAETEGRQHDEARAALNKHFSVKRVAELQPMIDAHVKRVVAGIPTGETFDIIADLAAPVIAGIVDEHLGLAAENPPAFFLAIAAVAAGVPGQLTDPETMPRFQRCWQYVVDRIEELMKNPGDDVISHLAREVEPSFTLDEIQSMTLNVILGGSETAANLTAHSMIRLESDPAGREELRADPRLLPRWLDEALRMSDIVVGIARTVTRDVELGGAQLREGDRIWLALAGANHDPARFERPREFDIGRGSAGHVATGAGSHFCLGANLAKAMIGTIMLELFASGRDWVIEDGVEKNEIKATSNVFHRVPAHFVERRR